ncbi:MAG: alpha/beta fold hydrolase [Acidimicrobiia bacterium]
MPLRRVTAGAVDLAVTEEGEGGRPLLLVHGFTGAKEDFAPLFTPLAATGWHAAAPDLRGHGESGKPAGEASYGLEAFVGDALSTADALGWERFVLVGHSMGGAVAQRLALDHPHRVEALVLMSTFHGPLDIDPGLVALGVAVVRQGGMAALHAVQEARRQQDEAAVAARARMEAAHPGQRARGEARLTACSPDMWTAMAPRFTSWPDTLDEVAGLDVPTLVLVGAEDDTMRPHCERLAAVIPAARLAVLDGVRHSPHLEDTDRCWAVLAGFLERLA